MVKTLSIGRNESRKFASSFTDPHCVLRLLEHDEAQKAIEFLDSDTFKIRRVPFGAIKLYKPEASSKDVNLPGKMISTYLANTDEPSVKIHQVKENNTNPSLVPTPAALALEYQSEVVKAITYNNPETEPRWASSAKEREPNTSSCLEKQAEECSANAGQLTEPAEECLTSAGPTLDGSADGYRFDTTQAPLFPLTRCELNTSMRKAVATKECETINPR